MRTSRPTTITRRGLLASAAGLTLAATVPAAARADEGSIERWAQANAVGLTSVDPQAPIDDLRALQRTIGGAMLVGLGEPAHNLAEITTLKHRVLRLLVERLGFRSLIWEDDWSLGVLIDEYLRTGEGDLSELVGEMSTAWQNQQVVDLLTWLRRHNVRHPHDQVRFVGAEHYGTRPFIYDRLADYLAETAPGQFPEAQKLIKKLQPDNPNIGEYARSYWEEVTDKQPYLDRAARLREIVDGLCRSTDDRRHSFARQTARQIESFYVHYSLPLAEIPTYRDAGSARTIRWWLGHSRTRAAYWAATAHTSRAAELQISTPEGSSAWVPAGSHLARWYGDRYRVIGFAFNHGSYPAEDGTIELPEPLPEWYERRLGAVEHEQFAIDLRRRFVPAATPSSATTRPPPAAPWPTGST